MNDDFVILNDVIKPPNFGSEKWYDYYTLWSVILFSLTLILILIDQFHEFLPGWWIAFMFANIIVVGLAGTLIVTINADSRGTDSAKNRLEYAYSQLFFHTVPFVIAVGLLLLFPTILKPFKVWQVVVAFSVLLALYLCVPTSNCRNVFIWKLKQVYINPNLYLLIVTCLGLVAITVYIEKKLIEMHT